MAIRWCTDMTKPGDKHIDLAVRLMGELLCLLRQPYDPALLPPLAEYPADSVPPLSVPTLSARRQKLCVAAARLHVMREARAQLRRWETLKAQEKASDTPNILRTWREPILAEWVKAGNDRQQRRAAGRLLRMILGGLTLPHNLLQLVKQAMATRRRREKNQEKIGAAATALLGQERIEMRALTHGGPVWRPIEPGTIFSISPVEFLTIAHTHALSDGDGEAPCEPADPGGVRDCWGVFLAMRNLRREHSQNVTMHTLWQQIGGHRGAKRYRQIRKLTDGLRALGYIKRQGAGRGSLLRLAGK